jgi:predicted transcriptional regulator
MSIKPKYADKIFSGEKKWEYRKKLWKRDDVDIVVVYASAPISKVIGEFQIVTINGVRLLYEGSIDNIVQTVHDPEYKRDLWWETGEESGISAKEFKEYFKDTVYGYAIKICNPQLYGIPRDLKRAYGISRPPQNFMYLPDEGGIDER